MVSGKRSRLSYRLWAGWTSSGAQSWGGRGVTKGRKIDPADGRKACSRFGRDDVQDAGFLVCGCNTEWLVGALGWGATGDIGREVVLAGRRRRAATGTGTGERTVGGCGYLPGLL